MLFRSRAGARRVGRDRAVVDDAPALRLLALHQPEGAARAEEHAVQVDVDHLLPGAPGELTEVGRRHVGAGVVEQQVEAAEVLVDAGEHPLDGIGIADVARSEEHTSELQSLMRTSYAVFCLNTKNNLT